MKFWRIAFGSLFLVAFQATGLTGQSDAGEIIFLKEYGSPLRSIQDGKFFLHDGDSILMTSSGEGAPHLIILMNHTETDTIGLDPGLSIKGARQADKLARVFDNNEVNGVYITHYRRTYLTVQPLVEALTPSVYRYEVGDQSFFAEQLLNDQTGIHLVVGDEKSLPSLTRFLLAGKDPGLDYGGHDFLIIGKVEKGRITELYKLKY